jgi:hypothetical protein
MAKHGKKKNWKRRGRHVVFGPFKVAEGTTREAFLVQLSAELSAQTGKPAADFLEDFTDCIKAGMLILDQAADGSFVLSEDVDKSLFTELQGRLSQKPIRGNVLTSADYTHSALDGDAPLSERSPIERPSLHKATDEESETKSAVVAA